MPACGGNGRRGSDGAEWERFCHGLFLVGKECHDCVEYDGRRCCHRSDQFSRLVRLVDGSNGFNFSDLGNADGRDIRFTDTVGTDLSYQIERCATPYAEVWVLVPLVKGTTSGLTTHIKMYWGKPGQTTTGSGSAVFSTTNGFIGVYHLSEGGTGTRYNSAQSSYNGTTVGYGGTESGNGDIAFGRQSQGRHRYGLHNLGAGSRRQETILP